jgi:hypothetical protein
MNGFSETAAIVFVVVSLGLVIKIGFKFLKYLLIRLIRWLYINGHWFPKTVKSVREEDIAAMKEEGGKIDLYIEEMEKISSGVFR